MAGEENTSPSVSNSQRSVPALMVFMGSAVPEGTPVAALLVKMVPALMVFIGPGGAEGTPGTGFFGKRGVATAKITIQI